MSNVSSSPSIAEQGSLVTKALRALKKHSSNKTLVSTVGTSLIVFAITAVQGILLARLLGPEMRGEYGTIFLYTQTLTFIGLIGIEYALARRAANPEVNLIDLRRCAVRAGLITGMITFAVVAILSLIALPADKQHLAMLCILCGALLPIEHIRRALLAVDHGSSVFWRFNLSDLFYSAAFPVLLLAMFLLGIHTLEYLTIMRVSVSLIALLFLISLIKNRSLFRSTSTSPRAVIKEGKPYAFSVAACDLFSRIDMLAILWLADFTTQGFYFAAVPAVSLLLVTPKALALFSFNAGAKVDQRWTTRTLLKNGSFVVGFQIAVSMAYALVLPWLIVLVYGIEFKETVPFALALLPATAIAGCATVADGFLRGRNQSTVGVWSRVAAAVVTLLAVGALYPIYEVMAIPLAVCIGQLVNFIWMVWFIAADSRRNQPVV